MQTLLCFQQDLIRSTTPTASAQLTRAASTQYALFMTTTAISMSATATTRVRVQAAAIARKLFRKRAWPTPRELMRSTMAQLIAQLVLELIAELIVQLIVQLQTSECDRSGKGSFRASSILTPRYSLAAELK